MMDILKGKTLLIVEDEPDLREPLVEEFHSLGCKVLEASNGMDAFEILKTTPVDAVISDIRMPGGDGVELLKNIKTLNFAFPTVMLITGFSDLSREEAYDLGAEAILAKPFDLDEIGKAVVRILTPRELRWQSELDLSKIKSVLEREFNELNGALGNGDIRLGRGGIFIRMPNRSHSAGEMVGLKIKFSQGQVQTMEGVGVVRWVRHQEDARFPPGYGIEFESLSDSCRQSILELSDRLKIKSYIPRT